MLGAVDSKKGTNKLFREITRQNRDGPQNGRKKLFLEFSCRRDWGILKKKIELGRAFKNWARFGLVEGCGKGILSQGISVHEVVKI